MKQEYAKQNGITLISIPFWWGGSPSVLQSVIRWHRPDLLIDTPIPNTFPLSLEVPAKFNKFSYTRNRVQEVTAETDPTGWYIL